MASEERESNGPLPDVPKARGRWFGAATILLSAIFLVELIVSARQQSPTIDEGCYLYAGFSYWTRADFGLNPEHPPLAKLLIGLPLLRMPLRYPAPPARHFKTSEYIGAHQFLFSNNADAMLFRARAVVVAMALAAALVVFAAGWEMFGPVPALLALLLFVLEPNVIAHGSLATTDMAMTLFLFATVYAFYRYVKKPSWMRLLSAGLMAGLALASKHSGLLCLPILPLLALFEWIWNDEHSKLAQGGRRKHAGRLALSLGVVAVLSVAVLWACYGFRYRMRRQDPAVNPPFAEYVADMHWPLGQKAVSAFARYHLLPESYLYGFADVIIMPRYFAGYLFGDIYQGHGRWLYFPAAFAVKSTLALMLLLLLLPLAIALRRTHHWRELVFLLVPLVLYFGMAMRSGFNIGVRHILPIYPFLALLAAFAAWQLGSSWPAWKYAVAAILLCDIVSSARVFPNYLPYANEIWGGPANTYKYLSDSNVDWGQQLKATRQYLDRQGIKDCWFDYFGRTVADPAYYGISCKPLPDLMSTGPDAQFGIVQERVEGTVLISATELFGGLWGPGELNPYAPLRKIKPDDMIAYGVFVFRGQFDLPLVAASSHANASSQLAEAGKLNEALAEAQAAVAIAPTNVYSQFVLGDALRRLKRKDESKQAFERALNLAQTIYPEYQADWVPYLKKQLAQ